MSGTGHASARTVALSAALALAALAAPDAFARAKADRIPPSSRLVLDNGFEAILIPNRAVPLVTSVVVVRAGVERETPQTNGISHMLEHLLFNGTARRTQEQIAAEQARYGIINNAHTGTTHTDFFVMASREEFHRALDLQADMLFNSTIPDAILEKERGIVLNEIARDRAAHHTAVAELFAEVLYRPGPLAMPALGTPESIEAMPRAAIVGYYTRWYVPNNMTAILMGDFDPEEMAPLVRHAFGGAAPGPLVAAPANPIDPTALGRTHDRRVEAGGRTLRLGAPAPGIGEAAFGTAWLLAGLLDHQLAPASNRRLPADAGGAILSAGVSLETHGAAAAFVVEAELDASLDWNQAASAVRSEIAARLGQGDWKTDELDRVRIAEKASMLRLWEKPHYFGLDRAPLIAAGGWEYTRDFLRHLDWVEPSDLKDLARPLSAESSWATFRVGPDAPAPQGADARPPAPAAEAQPSRPTRESRALVDAWKPARPAGDSTPPALARRTGAAPDRINVLRVLPNGLTLSLDVSDESRVFAASVLALNRAAAEPAGRTGIADMLHRLAGEATRSRPGPALEEALRAIGGTLKTSDDPAIPYDDIYLSHEYSYIRLEALDEFAPEALALLRDLLAEPQIADAPAIDAAREKLRTRSLLSAASARETCMAMLARSLWGAGHPFAAPLFGTPETLASITAEDLASFHAAYFSPRNLVVAIATSIPAGRILPVIERTLGVWDTGAKGRLPAPPAPAPARSAQAGQGRLTTRRMDAPQTCVAWGRLTPPAPEDPAAIEAMAGVLSSRMSDHLRERLGLAYSLGAQAASLADRLQVTAWMGTLPEQATRAREGLRAQIVGLLESPPTDEEIADAERSGRVRSLMRGLSRINQAHGRCLEELRRRAGRRQVAGNAAAKMTAARVLKAARELIEPGPLSEWTEAVAGREVPPESP